MIDINSPERKPAMRKIADAVRLVAVGLSDLSALHVLELHDVSQAIDGQDAVYESIDEMALKWGLLWQRVVGLSNITPDAIRGYKILPDQDVHGLAEMFRTKMLRAIGTIGCAMVDEENQKRADGFGPSADSCASHDHCDANMIMDAAAAAYFGSVPEFWGTDVALTSLSNAAWDKVKAEGFCPPDER